MSAVAMVFRAALAFSLLVSSYASNYALPAPTYGIPVVPSTTYGVPVVPAPVPTYGPPKRLISITKTLVAPRPIVYGPPKFSITYGVPHITPIHVPPPPKPVVTYGAPLSIFKTLTLPRIDVRYAPAPQPIVYELPKSPTPVYGPPSAEYGPPPAVPPKVYGVPSF